MNVFTPNSTGWVFSPTPETVTALERLREFWHLVSSGHGQMLPDWAGERTVLNQWSATMAMAMPRMLKELGAHRTEKCVGVVLKPFAIDDLLAEIKRGLDASTGDPWMLAKPSG